MADDTGKKSTEAEGGDVAAESFNDSETTTAEVLHLVTLVKSLEIEKAELVKTKEEMKEKWRKLEEGVIGLENMKEKLDELAKKGKEDGRAFAAISSRAGSLETELLRLQQELATTMSESNEANAELSKVKKALKEAKLTVREMEKENDSLRKMFLGEIQDLKAANSGSDVIVAGLESMIKEVRESGSTKLAVKKDQVRALTKKVAELEADVASGRSELEKEKAEKEALKEVLKASEEKVAELEAKLFQSQCRVEEAEKLISELKENAAKVAYSVVDRDAVLVDEGSNKGTTLLWGVAAGASAAAAAVAVVGGLISLHCVRKR